MSDSKLYNKERDIIQLDDDGGYYCKHVCAMTRESLHDKSDIAAELGYRDKLINDLREALGDMLRQYSSHSPTVAKSYLDKARLTLIKSEEVINGCKRE